MYSKVCSHCFRVANMKRRADTCLCDNCFSPDNGQLWGATRIREMTMDGLLPMLWSVFSHAKILRNETIDTKDKQAQVALFDFVVPEYRLAIDFYDGDNVPPKFGMTVNEIKLSVSERETFDSMKEAVTRNNDYRWLVLPTEINEARNILLDSLNTVYVKRNGGESHILTPRMIGDIGWDLKAAQDAICNPGCGTDIPSDVYLEIPNHLYAIVQARSSTSKRRLLVLNGLLDPCYRGSIYTMVFNPTQEAINIKEGDRIAQLVFYHRVAHIHTEKVDDLRQSSRNKNCFGSTGK